MLDITSESGWLNWLFPEEVVRFDPDKKNEVNRIDCSDCGRSINPIEGEEVIEGLDYVIFKGEKYHANIWQCITAYELRNSRIEGGA